MKHVTLLAFIISTTALFAVTEPLPEAAVEQTAVEPTVETQQDSVPGEQLNAQEEMQENMNKIISCFAGIAGLAIGTYKTKQYFYPKNKSPQIKKRTSCYRTDVVELKTHKKLKKSFTCPLNDQTLTLSKAVIKYKSRANLERSPIVYRLPLGFGLQKSLLNKEVNDLIKGIENYSEQTHFSRDLITSILGEHRCLCSGNKTLFFTEANLKTNEWFLDICSQSLCLKKKRGSIIIYLGKPDRALAKTKASITELTNQCNTIGFFNNLRTYGLFSFVIMDDKNERVVLLIEDNNNSVLLKIEVDFESFKKLLNTLDSIEIIKINSENQVVFMLRPDVKLNLENNESFEKESPNSNKIISKETDIAKNFTNFLTLTNTKYSDFNNEKPLVAYDNNTLIQSLCERSLEG